jgi:multiple sugar transport system permease protein
MTRRLAATGLLIAALVVWALPVLWVVVTSFKPHTAIFSSPPTLVFSPTLEHYRRVLGVRGGRFLEPTAEGIVPSIGNSVVVTAFATLVTLAAAVPAGYAYARLRFRGRKALAFYTLFTQMAPPIGLLIPYFLFLNRLRLMDTYVGLITVYLTFTLPFGIWLMITYFEELPRELEEAAAVDGATRWATLWRIVLPQVRGGIAVTAVFAFINAWNEFLYAAVLSGTATRTAPVALFGFVSTEEHLWGPFTATGTMIMGPVIVVALVAQRQLVHGLTFGAIRPARR